MSPQDNINIVTDSIDKSIDKLLNGVSRAEQTVFNKAITVVKNLDLDAQGNIKQTVKNLRLLARMRLELKNAVLTPSFQKQVEAYLNTFPVVAQQNNTYFKAIDAAFDPNRQLYREVLKNSLTTTQESLLGAGVDENIIKPVTEILNNAVTGNSRFADLTKELELAILGDSETLGRLMRYSKQIATDAMNQFNGNYNQTIGNDLDLEWYYYSGMNRKTSRPFCKKYSGKYFHKKEVEDFGRGKDLDGSKLCTGNFCNGRVKGTNQSNIFRYRGGYNCRHGYKPTLIDQVSNNVIKRNIDKGYYDNKDNIDVAGIKPKEVTPIYSPSMSRKDAEIFIKNS